MKFFLMDCIDEEGAPENVPYMQQVAGVRQRLHERDVFAEVLGDRRPACKTILKRQ